MRSIYTCTAVLLGCSFVTASSNARQMVTELVVTELGTLGGDESEARSINNRGIITGWADTSDGKRHAFKYRANDMDDIHFADALHESKGLHINENNTIVGYAYSDDTSRAFVYDPPDSTVLKRSPVQSLHGGLLGDASKALSINNDSIVVGDIEGGYGAQWQPPFSSAKPTYVISRTTQEPYSAEDINDSSVIVGHDKRTEQGFRVRNGHYRSMVNPVSLLSVPGFGFDSDAIAINNTGQIVGWGLYVMRESNVIKTHHRAILWSGLENDPSIDLGVLPGGVDSEANDINEQGYVVGWSSQAVTFQIFLLYRNYAFLWHKELGMVHLPGPASAPNAECTAFGLNDKSSDWQIQVVGSCTLNGKLRAVRWDVRTALVPELPYTLEPVATASLP